MTANPSGLTILKRMKERALKDVTNKLDASPVSLKPAWNGLRVGVCTNSKEAAMAKKQGPIS